MMHQPSGDSAAVATETAFRPRWQRSIERAIREPSELLRRLRLPPLGAAAEAAHGEFRVFVPLEFLRKMRPADPHDPLLLQVLPQEAETAATERASADAVGDAAAQTVPGLLQKYEGRVLFMPTMNCAVHCRYCFRRNYLDPGFFQSAPRAQRSATDRDPLPLPRRWRDAISAVRENRDIHEVILSGGDPLTLADDTLRLLADAIDSIPHVATLRIHTRLPVLIPSRITRSLRRALASLRLQVICVIHANHPAELDEHTRRALQRLRSSGTVVMNQSVLLRGVNDSASVLVELSRALLQCGVLPYYLHQLDRVRGVTHFEVPEEEGRRLVAEMRRVLPGYAVPQYVREVAGAAHKVPLD